MAGLFDGFEGHRVLAETEVDRALASALVALDANVLLNLYRYNARTSDDLITVLESLGQRLVIPHQAIREFHRNRLSAIGNPQGAAQEVRESLQKNLRSTRDALSRWAKQVAVEDGHLDDLQGAVDTVFERLRDAVDEAAPDRVQADTPAAADRVLERLSALIDGKVLPQPAEKEWELLVAEGRARVERRQPPGFLDAGKGDEHPEGPSGDFLVYRQACDEAARRDMDLVIITGDEKEDWWWRHRSAILGPLPEMTKEFYDLSGGHRLHLLRPRDLLLRSAAVLDVQVNPASVEDVGRERDELGGTDTWTEVAVTELLRRLDAEGQLQAEVIREAAVLGGTISRAAVYEICGYDDDRMLRGFTRPVTRVTAELKREELLAEDVSAAIVPLYPDGVRASAFRVHDEIVSVLKRLANGITDAASTAEES